MDPAIGGVGDEDAAALDGDRGRLPGIAAFGRKQLGAQHEVARVDHQQPAGRARVGDIQAVAVGGDGARIGEGELSAGHVLEPAGAEVEAAQPAGRLVEQPDHPLAVDCDVARRDQAAKAAGGVAEHRERAGQRRQRQHIVVLADPQAAAVFRQRPGRAAAQRHPQGVVRRRRRRRDQGCGAHAPPPSSALRTEMATASTRISAPAGIGTSSHCGFSTSSSVIASSGTRSTPSSKARR